MLILPPGHAQTLGVMRPLRSRERWMLGGVITVVTALLLAVAISFAAGGHSSAHGCVDVTIPYSTGGQEVYRCGAAARDMCMLVGAPGGYTGMPARAVAGECRKAGLPVRSKPR
ncbi:MAG: hypothetical protein ACR2LV_08925 [Solirubrobacteraceae bacterium]